MSKMDQNILIVRFFPPACVYIYHRCGYPSKILFDQEMGGKISKRRLSEESDDLVKRKRLSFLHHSHSELIN